MSLRSMFARSIGEQQLPMMSLGVGTYRVDIKINGNVVGSATFGLN